VRDFCRPGPEFTPPGPTAARARPYTGSSAEYALEFNKFIKKHGSGLDDGDPADYIIIMDGHASWNVQQNRHQALEKKVIP
jgi:hypothetical protein